MTFQSCVRLRESFRALPKDLSRANNYYARDNLTRDFVTTVDDYVAQAWSDTTRIRAERKDTKRAYTQNPEEIFFARGEAHRNNCIATARVAERTVIARSTSPYLALKSANRLNLMKSLRETYLPRGCVQVRAIRAAAPKRIPCVRVLRCSLLLPLLRTDSFRCALASPTKKKPGKCKLRP